MHELPRRRPHRPQRSPGAGGIGTATAQQVRDFLLKEHGWAGLNGIYDFRDGTQRGVGAQSLVVVRYDKSTAAFSPVAGPQAT